MRTFFTVGLLALSTLPLVGQSNIGTYTEARPELEDASGVELILVFDDPSWTSKKLTLADLKIQAKIVDLDDVGARGDLFAGSSADSVVILQVGTDGQILSADSTNLTGMAWVDPADTGTDDQTLTAASSGDDADILIEGAGEDVRLVAGTLITLTVDTSGSPDEITIDALGDGTGTDDQNLTVGAGGSDSSTITIEDGTDVTISAGTSINVTESGSTITVTHQDVSSQGSVNNSGTSVIQDITLNSEGHITGITTTNLGSHDGTGTDNQNLTVGSGGSASSVIQIEDGTNVTLGAGDSIDVAESGSTITFSHEDVSSQNSINASGTTVVQDITLNAEGHITGISTTDLGPHDGTGTDDQTLTAATSGGNADLLIEGAGEDVRFIAGSNVTLTVDASGTPDTITIDVSGGGGGGGTDDQTLTAFASGDDADILIEGAGEDVRLVAGDNITLTVDTSTTPDQITIDAAGGGMGTGTDDQDLSAATSGSDADISIEDGDDVRLVAGDNITLTVDTSATPDEITIASTGGGAEPEQTIRIYPLVQGEATTR